jgi:hypothetical protein
LIFSRPQFSPELFETVWQTEKLFPVFMVKNRRRIKSVISELLKIFKSGIKSKINYRINVRFGKYKMYKTDNSWFFRAFGAKRRVKL